MQPFNLGPLTDFVCLVSLKRALKCLELSVSHVGRELTRKDMLALVAL